MIPFSRFIFMYTDNMNTEYILLLFQSLISSSIAILFITLLTVSNKDHNGVPTNNFIYSITISKPPVGSLRLYRVGFFFFAEEWQRGLGG